MDERVEILLAVYNGERFLREQIDSLLGQRWTGWSLLARDDGSSDGSRGLLQAYQREHPAKIRVLFNDGGPAGTLSNFSALLERSTAPYVMFCDQDDVWLPDKIGDTLGTMRELERRHGGSCPLLVHTDMKVTDAGLRVVAESLWRYQKSDPAKGETLNRLLVQNCATGCSVMVNRALRELALPIPAEAVMHDWWLALVAAAFGGIGHRLEPTLLYRQHGANDVGAKQWSAGRVLLQLARPGGARAFFAQRSDVLRRVRVQASAFSARYASRLSPRQREMLAAYIALEESPFLRRKWHLVKFGFFHAGLARNIVRLLLW